MSENLLSITTYKTANTEHSPSEIAECLEQVLSNQKIGFLQIPARDQIWAESKALGQTINQNFDHLIVVGIGGSSMGPRVFEDITTHIPKTKPITFFDNPDTHLALQIKSLISTNKKIAYLFISKSGTTIEILWSIEWLNQLHTDLNKPFWPNTFFITETTGNTLHALSKKHDRPCLPVPLDVGGRFSVLTPVGLVIAQYLGLNLDKIRAGAVRALNDQKSILTLASQYLSSFERGEALSVFWMYSSQMRWFGGWLQQLWAESLGKKVNRTGGQAYAFSTPIAQIGACDQHSVLQQVIEGPKDKFVTVFRFLELESFSGLGAVRSSLFEETRMLDGSVYGSLLRAEALATRKGMELSGVATLSLELLTLDEEVIGYLFMLFQVVIAVLAEVKNVNAFDQPGVQLGKRLIGEMV